MALFCYLNKKCKKQPYYSLCAGTWWGVGMTKTLPLTGKNLQKNALRDGRYLPWLADGAKQRSATTGRSYAASEPGITCRQMQGGRKSTKLLLWIVAYKCMVTEWGVAGGEHDCRSPSSLRLKQHLNQPSYTCHHHTGYLPSKCSLVPQKMNLMPSSNSSFGNSLKHK